MLMCCINENSSLHYLLPEKIDCDIMDKLHHPNTFQSLTVKTERFIKTFIPYCLRHYNVVKLLLQLMGRLASYTQQLCS